MPHQIERKFAFFALVASAIFITGPFCYPAASQDGNRSTPFEMGPARRLVPARGAASVSAQFRPPMLAQNQAQPQNPAPAAPPPPPTPYRTEILRFDNWLVTCNEFESPKKRDCEARLQFVQANTNQLLLEWTVWLNDNNQLQTRLQTPTGVSIPVGVDLQPEKGPSRKLVFESCETSFCRAGMIMDGNLLRDLTASATAEVTIQASDGNRARFNLQIKGFAKAYAALRN
jgi:invasion protein IalB